MAVTSIKTDLREEILRILREDITYEVQDGDNGKNLSPRSIVFNPTRIQLDRAFAASNHVRDLPGLVVCEPLRTDVLDTGGTNERDEWHYHWMVQLVDNDLWKKPGRIATWEKWNEQIMSAFMFSCLNGVVIPPKGQVKFARATQFQDIDEKTWNKDGQFVSGIQIEVQVLQPRGISV